MAAFIKIWDLTVGAVSWDDNRDVAVMEFDADFIRQGIDLAPVVMPLSRLSAGERIYSFPALPKETFMGLPGILADALPDKYGNKLINAWLARQGRSEDDFNPVERLCYMGRRSMGALEFEPALLGTGDQSVVVEIEELVKLAGQVLNKKETFNARLGSDYEKALNEIIRVGTSAGGARAKAVIALNEKTGEMRSGQVDAPEGFEHWLLKFDGIKDEQLGDPAGFGRIEYAYYKMALQAGIKMNESRLLEEKNRAHFMTKRFDRAPGNEKIQVQTLCAVAHFDYNDPNSYSYEQLFQVMRKMKLPYIDAEEMYRRMVYNIAAKNLDDHTKNTTFILARNQRWRLSPAYDLIYSYNPNGKWTKRHQMSVNGKREQITLEDLLTIARENSIRSPKDIIGQVLDAVSQWKQFAAEAGLDSARTKEIQKNLQLNLLKY